MPAIKMAMTGAPIVIVTVMYELVRCRVFVICVCISTYFIEKTKTRSMKL